MRDRRKARGRPRPAAPEKGVRIELDLPHERLVPSSVPVLRQLEAWFREQEVEELGNFLLRVAQLLEELGGHGYLHVDHWEAEPGGWLPLPEATHAGRYEPVEHLIRALKSPAWLSVSEADSFAVRLTSSRGERADARVFHRHREREHSITIDLWGTSSPAELKRLLGSLRSRFSPLRLRLRR